MFRWDNGRQTPDLDEVKAILDELFVDAAAEEQEVLAALRARVLALAHDILDAADDNWLASGPGGTEQLAGVMDCERSARRITEWAPMTLPGPLQTRDYARAILSGGSLSPSEIENRLMVRLARQSTILSRTQPVQFVALIGEPALRSRNGGTEVMIDQLHHLIEVAERDTVTLQVISVSGAWHPGWAGLFTLYDFDDFDDDPEHASWWPSIVYTESHRGAAFYVAKDVVDDYRAAIRTIRAADPHYTPAESIDLIRAAIRDLESTTE